jgi:serine/threonine protein kinase
MVDSNLKKIDRYSFNLNDTLGQGSFGKVYKGKDDSTG